MAKAIAATAWIAGLLLAGAKAETHQEIWNMFGLILFAGSSWLLVRLSRGKL